MTKETKEVAKPAKKTKTSKKKDVDTGVLFEEEAEVLINDNDEVVIVKEEVPENIPENNGKIGTLLKEARIKQGKKLPEVSKDLCIRKVYLDAIENSNYKEVPEFPYGAGFVRSYADYLGLNGERLVQLFKEETNTKQEKRKDSLISANEEQVEVTTPNKKYIIISLLAILLVYVGWYLFNNKDTDAVTEPTTKATVTEETNNDDFPLIVEDYADTESESISPISVVDTAGAGSTDSQVVITEESFVEEVVEQEPVVEDTVEEAAAAEVVNGVVLNVKEEAWVEVKDADKLYLSKVLKAGDQYVVPNKGKGMIYSVGRRGAVDVVIDGKVTNVLPAGRSTNIKLDSFLNH